jgi:hypothetical protein
MNWFIAPNTLVAIGSKMNRQPVFFLAGGY